MKRFLDDLRLLFGDSDGTLLGNGDVTFMQVRFTSDFTVWQTNTSEIVISNGSAIWIDTNTIGLSNRFYQILEH